MNNNIKDEKKVCTLQGLGCANCAAKIEREINNIDGVKRASVNFVSKKLTVEVNDKDDLNEIMNKATVIVKKIEPDVKVVLKDNQNHKHEHGHSHDHSHDHSGEGDNKKKLLKLIVGGILFVIVMFFKFSPKIEFGLFFISYLIIGGEILLKAFRNILKGQVLDENFLMCVATIGAFAIKQFPEGVAVMIFYQVGEFFQDMAVEHSRKSISDLMDIRPDYANLKLGNDIKKVDPEEVKIGNIVIVKPGEKIPLDGKVIEGKSMADTSALTGESVPRKIEEGDQVLGGFVNKNGLLTIEVAKEFGQSTIAKILELVENASSRKAETENFITKFARYYTPIVVIMALMLALIPPLAIEGQIFSEWIYRALVFLVVSCPCALVISIPLGFFGGIGGASKSGILIKGGNYLEALKNVEVVVFDKTGTLTKGVFKVTEINPKKDITEEELLEYAAFAEKYSNHPIGVSILNAYDKPVDESKIAKYNEISGHGIQVKVSGKDVLAGNVKLMNRENIKYDKVNGYGTVIHVAVDKKYVGYIVISDEIKEDSKLAIKNIKDAGVKKTVMLTGDNSIVAKEVANILGLDEVYSELLPDEKVEKLEKIDGEKSSKGKVVFVGDGINDAPVLARADIGIAMGGLGSDAAIEAADVVIMTDEPSKIATAIKIAKQTRNIVWQNIIFALGVKAIVLILGALGFANMWEAVFADVGVALIAVLNSMRALKVNNI